VSPAKEKSEYCDKSRQTGTKMCLKCDLWCQMHLTPDRSYILFMTTLWSSVLQPVWNVQWLVGVDLLYSGHLLVHACLLLVHSFMYLLRVLSVVCFVLRSWCCSTSHTCGSHRSLKIMGFSVLKAGKVPAKRVFWKYLIQFMKLFLVMYALYITIHCTIVLSQCVVLPCLISSFLSDMCI